MTRYCINFYLSQQLIKFAIDIFRILFIAFNSHQFASTSHCIYKSEISNKLWLTHCSKASQCGSQRRFSKHTHGTKKPEKCATLLDCPEANIYLIWPLKRQLLFCTTGWAINKIDKLEILLILFASSSHGGGCRTTLEAGNWRTVASSSRPKMTTTAVMIIVLSWWWWLHRPRSALLWELVFVAMLLLLAKLLNWDVLPADGNLIGGGIRKQLFSREHIRFYLGDRFAYQFMSCEKV